MLHLRKNDSGQIAGSFPSVIQVTMCRSVLILGSRTFISGIGIQGCAVTERLEELLYCMPGELLISPVKVPLSTTPTHINCMSDDKVGQATDDKENAYIWRSLRVQAELQEWHPCRHQAPLGLCLQRLRCWVPAACICTASWRRFDRWRWRAC